MSDIVQKLWGFCHTLRHDGIDYGDYIEQLTYLLFLKMADERDIDLSALTIKTEKGKEIEVDCSWPTLIGKSGTAVTRPLRRHSACSGTPARSARRHLRRSTVAIQQPGQPQKTPRTD